MTRRAIAFAITSLCAACAPEGGEEAAPIDGPVIAIDVAALHLEGVGEAVWDLEVLNGDDDVVWQRRVTSSGYGDSAGSASYVGPCDADPAVALNTVRVWVVGVYADPVAAGDAGTFAFGSDAGVVGTPLPFQNPTATAPLPQDVTCVANGDVAVRFDVALMRPASQGFFDIAVNFNDIFCSAKLDCCHDTSGNGCAPDGSEDIALLFDADGARARTFVLGFACTAGAADGVVTELYLDDLALDCTSPNTGEDFAADLRLRPDGPNGNQCVPGADGMTACAGTVTELAGVDADSVLFQIAVYRGAEALTSGGESARKVYWNLALGVKAAISGCVLRVAGTADDRANGGDSVDGGEIAPGAVYPFIAWDVPLGTCASEALAFGVPGAPVSAGYTATGGAGRAFGYTFAPGLPSGPVCSAPCQNGTSCVAPQQCDCDGTGYSGASCDQPICTAPCLNGGVCSAPEVCDCSGTAGFSGPQCETSALFVRTFTGQWWTQGGCSGSPNWAPNVFTTFYPTLAECETRGATMTGAANAAACDTQAGTCNYATGAYNYGTVLPGCDQPGQTQNGAFSGWQNFTFQKYDVSGCQLYTP